MMNMQTAQLSTLPCLDNETRSHIEEIILTERDIINLEENIAELCGQLQQVHATLCGSCGQPIYRRNEPQKSVDNVLSAQKGESASENKNPTVESNSADLRMRNQDLTSFENNPIGHNSKMPMQSSGLFHEDATSRNLKKIEAGQENTGAFVQQPPSLAKDMPSKTLCSKSSTGESSFVLSADAAKSFSSWDENPMIMTENPESMKAQSKNSSGDKQPFHKLLPKLTYQSSGNRSSGITPASSADSRCSSSRKTALGDSMKRDALDFPASARRLSSHKKQPSGSSTEASTSLYEEQIALIRNNATRRHFPKSEEVASSSTLAKLTNRLNFLKERRVQLANELQNLDIGRAP
ncbi:hypothetical protein AXF42_Ash002736 [Apostasia shenzhenica]|uniref:Ternary complex factor MIP1 leucine-zipper domain-containing protein n=1 Tax=Apostasia shenzhenica TaxID=1088818 RepID=A0A2I0A752_9ASPA|nr:hypothetical protein AXF42_Ash002736 [Apostasia shenzhenica]